MMVVALFLAGCYQVSEPVITRGAYAPVAGRYVCTNSIDGRRSQETFTEKKDGFFRPDYRYTATSGTEMAFSDMGNNLFLSQFRESGRPILVAFMEPTANGIRFLVPNVMTEGAAIDRLVRETGISARPLDGGTISLSGPVAQVTAYLNRNDRSMLMTVVTCIRN